MLINFRGPVVKDKDSDRSRPAESKELEVKAMSRIIASAAWVWADIGFPERTSFVSTLLSRLGNVSIALVGLSTSLSLAPTIDRLRSSLRILFTVCAELKREREEAGLSALDAACNILIDEAQDLVKDSRLAAAGGRDVFRDLATLLVFYGVESHSVRTVVTGSSAFLAVEFAMGSLATASRVPVFELGDPEPEDLRWRLEERGYSAGDAWRMVDLCGTRLRRFEEPLAGAMRPAMSTRGFRAR